MQKNETVYTLTRHCDTVDEVASVLSGIGLGRGAILDECRKLATAGGPRAHVYHRVIKTLKSGA